MFIYIFFINFSVVFDRKIGDTFIRVDLVWFIDRICRAGIDTSRTVTTMIGGWFVIFQRYVDEDLTEQKI